MLKLLLFLQVALLGSSLKAATNTRSIHLFVNHKVGSNTTGHLLSVITKNFEHHCEADSLIFHFTDLGGIAKSYLNYLGVNLPDASRVIEDSARFHEKVNFQYHTIELLENDSVIYSGPLKLFDPSFLNKLWPAKPSVRPLEALSVKDLPYFHILDYLYPDESGFWLKSDNNILYKFGLDGRLVFKFAPEQQLPWQEIYEQVLRGKSEKLKTAHYYFDWFRQNNRYAFPMYDVHVSTDGHIYIHCAAQPFETSRTAEGKRILSAEPYIFLLKMNTRTFEWEILYADDQFNSSEKTYYDFDNLYIQNDIGFVSTEITKRVEDQVGLSSIYIKGNKIIKPRNLKFPNHGNPDFLSSSFIKTSIVETRDNLFVVRSRDSVIFDLNRPTASFTLPAVKSGRSFNLQRAGRMDADYWYLYHSNDDLDFILTIMKDTTVVHNFKFSKSNSLLLSKSFVSEKILYIPAQLSDGTLELRRFALRFRTD